MEWVYGMWWGLGCVVGLAVPLLLVIVALLRSRQPVVAMLREWLDRLSFRVFTHERHGRQAGLAPGRSRERHTQSSLNPYWCWLSAGVDDARDSAGAGCD